MPKKRKDTEYLSISARIRVMENRLLTRNRMERMLEARTDEETAKVLSECGYGELTDLTPTAVDAAMVRARDALCRDLEQAVPDRRLVELFQIKYDYHNAKVLLKGEKRPFMVYLDTVPPESFERFFQICRSRGVALSTPKREKWLRRHPEVRH